MGVARTQRRAAGKPAAAKPARSAASPPVNPHRGEVALDLGGKPYKLALTFNALVEIEQGLDVPLAKMGEVLAQPKLEHIRLIIGALVRGGGADLTDLEVGQHMINIEQATAAMLDAFIAAGVFKPGEDAEPGASLGN